MVSVLDDRLARVHEAVVTSYIRHGQPVGSRYVWTSFKIGLSPASIRSLMAELEGLGLLSKPHTSAGRIPTEKGYRFYVDRLVKTATVAKSDARSIRHATSASISLEEALERVCMSLESLSHQASVAVLPGSTNGVVISVETARVGPHRLAVTVGVEPGTERTILLEVGSNEEDRAACRLLAGLARAIVGKDLDQAVKIVCRIIQPEAGLGGGTAILKRRLVGLLRQPCHGVHVSGTGNLVSALDDASEAGLLLDILESKEAIADLLLSDGSRHGVSVRIGTETRCKPMKLCSVVRSAYGVGGTEGAIGIIGPLRMEYPRFMALVGYASAQLTRFLAKGGGRYKGDT